MEEGLGVSLKTVLKADQGRDCCLRLVLDRDTWALEIALKPLC